MRGKRTLLSAMAVLLGSLLLIGPSLAIGRAQAPNQAGLVVQLGDGSLITRCIDFSESEINSYDLLLRSGLTVVTSGDPTVGMAVCNIEAEGCPASDCFCQCKGSTCTYWSYWHLVDGAWQYSSLGASGHTAAPGDVEGWHWGEAQPPPVIPLAEICVPPATDTPEPTPTWTSSPTPLPTDTPSPSPEPSATWTPSPSALPPTDTPLPTDTPDPTVTEAATATPTTKVPIALQATPEPVPESGGSGQAGPTITSTPDASSQVQPTAAPAPTDTSEPPPPTSPPPTPIPVVQSSATPAQIPPATVTPAAVMLPTNTPLPLATQVALAADPASGARSDAAQAGQESGQTRSNKNLLTILSVGVGMAYIFFVLFVVVLAGLFVLVRLRQR